MEISVFLAKAWGIILILIPLSFWFDKSNFEELLKISKNKKSLFLSGMICLPLGAVMVAGHNIWSWDWRLILTLFGWIFIAKGILLLSSPHLVTRIMGIAIGNENFIKISFALSFVLGIYLARTGFFF